MSQTWTHLCMTPTLLIAQNVCKSHSMILALLIVQNIIWVLLKYLKPEICRCIDLCEFNGVEMKIIWNNDDDAPLRHYTLLFKVRDIETPFQFDMRKIDMTTRHRVPWCLKCKVRNTSRPILQFDMWSRYDVTCRRDILIFKVRDIETPFQFDMRSINMTWRAAANFRC